MEYHELYQVIGVIVGVIGFVLAFDALMPPTAIFGEPNRHIQLGIGIVMFGGVVLGIEKLNSG